jgi:hypothetical protein
MTRIREEQAGSDGWTEWIHPLEGYKFSCCDCGLVHILDFRVRGRRVEMRVRRDNRSTGQVRRWKRPRPGRLPITGRFT